MQALLVYEALEMLADFVSIFSTVNIILAFRNRLDYCILKRNKENNLTAFRRITIRGISILESIQNEITERFIFPWCLFITNYIG